MLDAAFVPFRRWSSLLVCPMLALEVGCAPPAPQTLVGVSDAVPEAEPAPASSPAGPRWSDFAAARGWPEAAPVARALGHRRDGTLLRVRIDPAIPGALEAYRALATESSMPEGARIMAWHETPSGALLGGSMLEKRGGAWSGLAIDEHGAVIPGDRAACVRCHDMAPSDHLFGAPRADPAPRAESIAPPSR